MNIDMGMHVTLNELHGDEAGTLENIGNLCCKMIEVTNFQLCPGMLRADQIHLRNVHFWMNNNNHNTNATKNENNNNNDNDYSKMMETECLFIMNVSEVHYYASLHSLKRSSVHANNNQASSSSSNNTTNEHRRSRNRASNNHRKSTIFTATDHHHLNQIHNAAGRDEGESTYVCLVRRTNAPLFPRNEADGRKNGASTPGKLNSHEDGTCLSEEDGDLNTSSMGEEDIISEATPRAGGNGNTNDKNSSANNNDDKAGVNHKARGYNHEQHNFPDVHSQPFFVCMTLNDELVNSYILNKHNRLDMERIITDGPFQCCLDFSQLSKLERPGEDSSKVHLIFRTGEAIEIETMSSEMMIDASHYNSGEVSEVSFRRASVAGSRTATMGNHDGSGEIAAPERKVFLRKDRVMWCILQLHALLVDEEDNLNQGHGMSNMTQMLTTNKYVDKVELQYKAAVHGFLADHASLFALIERQRLRDVMGDKGDTSLSMSRIFSSEKEEKEAEEVLNSTASNDLSAEELVELLQRRMRDLESDACRRLIAWEDEKNRTRATNNKATLDNDSMSLVDLYNSLEKLDAELVEMHTWLSERAVLIKPLTDDCFDIERENEALHQQWVSFGKLGTELRHLLDDINVAPEHIKILNNPASVRKGSAYTEGDIEVIMNAGREMKHALDRSRRSGSIHLQAMFEKVKGLLRVSDKFCSELAIIIKSVVTELAGNNFSGLLITTEGKTHKHICRAIRDGQRKYHASLLLFIPLVEIISYLKPELLPDLRDVYRNTIAEKLLGQDLMKRYFGTLPGGTSASTTLLDLKDYEATRLRNPTQTNFHNADGAAVVKLALSEMLPVIVREAFFTSAFFRLTKNIDGRSKKANFDIAKTVVDFSSAHFRIHLSRSCGLGSLEGQGDPMLAFVSSFLLNESMEGYYDKQKKGGDHSLSLAYIRSTILDLRKQVDKQWGSWIDKQITWVLTNPGVPENAKYAGVLSSFARFPTYLDHVVSSCKGMADPANLGKVKVVCHYLQKLAGALFESLNDCATREGVDAVYAANVIRMENSYYFFQAIKRRQDIADLFQKQLSSANAICKQNLSSYIGWMIKREFRQLYQLFASISKLKRDVGEKDVQIHVPKNKLLQTLSNESGRDVVEEKVKTMYTRCEKHLSEMSGLLPFAWKALVKDLYTLFGRWEKLSSQCYGVVISPGAVDIVRMAKDVGSGNGIGGNSESEARRRGSISIETMTKRLTISGK